MSAEYKWHGDKIQKKIEDRLEVNMNKAVTLVHHDATNNAPVKTGTLKRSLTMRVESEDKFLVGIVGTNLFYAPYQEFGTSRMPAHPYLFPALEKNRHKIMELLGK